MLEDKIQNPMLRIKEVEMFDSVDDFKTSRSIQGHTHFPNFEMLDATIASALNKIIQNSNFKKKVSVEEQKARKEDRFLRGRQIAYMIYDYFRATGANDTIPDYADLFSINLRNDDVQEFDTKWDEILLSMSKIPPDDVLENLHKLRIRESDQLKTVLELYNMEIHQKISMPDYQKLRTMVKRSIDQKLWLRSFDARKERIERRAVVTNRKGQRGVEGGQGECYQWKVKGQCSGGDKCVVSRTMKISVKNRHQKPLDRLNHQHKEVEVRRGKRTSVAGVRLGSSLDSRAKSTWKVFAPNHIVIVGILPNVNSGKSESGYKFGDKCSFAHRHVEGQPSTKPKKRMVTKKQWLYWKMHDSWVA